ncbi:MAG: UvrB/UvrC motif-containing protein [Clostridium sp.]
MKCDKCGKREAIINIIKVSKEEEKSLWLCEECAKEMVGLSPSKEEVIDGKFQGLINGFIQALNTTKKSGELEKLKCDFCGYTYMNFKDSGEVGCENCYRAFNTQIRPIVKRIHGDLEHIGKIPKRTGKEIIISKNLKRLRYDLQKAIIDEEYEEAAIIRDKIKSIENNLGE